MRFCWSHAPVRLSNLRVSCFSVFLLWLSAAGGFAQEAGVTVAGELRTWHAVRLEIQGPETDELATPNPFYDYRLDVTFRQGDRSYTVPGFYAADGNAAETGASRGNLWVTYFAPDAAGEWTYEVAFKQGAGISVATQLRGAKAASSADGATGSFVVAATDKVLPDNRAKGRLQYVGKSYLRFAATGDYFIKLGVDAPENLLAFSDIDATPNALGLRKTWAPHARDLGPAAETYTWRGGKGHNLLGAIDYLAQEQLNVFSFLTFNVDGDDRNVFPHRLKTTVAEYEVYASQRKNKSAWPDLFHTKRFDVSKLEQWERVFAFGESQGMFLHFKTHETETDHIMDGGVFGDENKLYYRELIARFGHHLALNWNLGEENNQPIPEVVKAAEYVAALDPYGHHMVVHTFPNQDDRYAELVGDQSRFTGASLQLSDSAFRDVHPRVLKWRTASEATGRSWALAVDEPGKANTALLPDDEDPLHNDARGNAMWGTLLAGGYGVEWYFGYASPNSDLTCEDFRSRARFWPQNVAARRFFERYLPFWEMVPADELVAREGAFCLAKSGDTYAIYLHSAAEATSLRELPQGASFQVQWYNPRQGGALQVGTKASASQSSPGLGLPPGDLARDWVALVRKAKS